MMPERVAGLHHPTGKESPKQVSFDWTPVSRRGRVEGRMIRIYNNVAPPAQGSTPGINSILLSHRGAMASRDWRSKATAGSSRRTASSDGNSSSRAWVTRFFSRLKISLVEPTKRHDGICEVPFENQGWTPRAVYRNLLLDDDHPALFFNQEVFFARSSSRFSNFARAAVLINTPTTRSPPIKPRFGRSDISTQLPPVRQLPITSPNMNASSVSFTTHPPAGM